MTQSFQELLTTNYGLLPSGYTGSQGAMGYTGSAGSSGVGGGGPKITNIQATNSSYTVLDDTAIDIAGGYVKLTGTGFESGCIVMVNNIPATSTTFVSSTEVRAQLPATAAGTYVVYLVNTDGGVAIRINGVTFSTTPTWTTASILAESPDSVAVSIQLAATGASTYSLAAGSTLPGTLTVSSSGLISGMLPALESLTTYSFTVLATDAELQDSPRTFSITITTGDPFFNSTTLLLPGTANTFVKDASANNLTATVVGNAKPSTFNPYLTGWSNFFDGTGDYLRVPSTGAGFSSITTFTYECWIQPTSALGTNCIFDISESQPFRFVLSGSNVTWQASSSGATILTATFTWVIGAWHHVAFVRDSSNNISIFINGTRYATANYGGSWGATQAGGVNIGCNRGDTWFFPGYISNARFVKGTAIYDPTQTTISVPTTPLTAVAGTSLLTCADNRFIDDSVDNLAVTVNGDVKVQSFSPFVEPATTRGSAYFAGGTSYVTVPVAASTGDLTIECWIYPTAYTSPRGFVLTSGVNDSTAWAVSYGTTGVLSLWVGSYSNPSVASPNTIPLNTWGHIAIVKTAGTVYMYTNGVRSTGAGQAGTFGSSTNVHIATYNETPNTQSFAGYVSNFRYVNGTALYTGATATPPASPLTAVTGTRFLTLQNNTPVDNSTFLDSSSNNLLVTRAGNTTQGTFSPYSPSGWSNYFDGSGDYLSTVGSSINFGTSNFTIEWWVYRVTAYTTDRDELPMSGVGGTSFMLGMQNGILQFGVSSTSWNITSSITVPLSVWTHAAICRVGSTVTMYINGVSAGTASMSTNFTGATAFDIGRRQGASINQILVYCSNLRVVKGTAVYTAAFTPSTQPLTAVAGTSLLTCADNRFIDESPINSAITRNGDVRVTNWSPFKAVVQTPVSYSAYFDGTNSSLTVPANTAFQLTGDFTVEAWIYPTALSGTANMIIGSEAGSATDWFGLIPTQLQIVINNSATNWNYAFSTNTWYHVAVARSGTNLTAYVNGVSLGTNTRSEQFLNTGFGVMVGRYGFSAAFWFTGLISNARIVKGTALYTTNFTPSTQPLTAIAGTSLLTCQSATFVDNSTNRFAITAAGNSQPSMVNPFGSTFANSTGYTAAEYGGSMYFDGTGDYLELPTNAALALPGDFTMEAWVYLVAGGAITGFVSTYRNNTQSGAVIGINGSNQILFRLGNDNSGFQVTDPAVLPIGTWNHIVGVRSGSTMTLYKNGVSVGSVGSVNISCDNTIAVINSYYSTMAGYHGNCYISGARILKGAALYTSNFVPPIAPVLPVQNTVLLLNGTSAAITDATTKNVLETVGDARISTAVSKFGGSSMYFDGTGDYLLAAPGPLLEVGNNDFTIEFWWYRTASGRQALYHGSWGTDWSLGIDFSSASPNNSNTIGIWASSNGTTWNLINSDGGGNGVGTITVEQNAWAHIAFVRSGTTWMSFVNGVRDRNLTGISGSVVNRATSSKAIGAWFSDAAMAKASGYIQDFRITKGVARYTANFTPPVAALIAK